jgi:hypothetical protein
MIASYRMQNTARVPLQYYPVPGSRALLMATNCHWVSMRCTFTGTLGSSLTMHRVLGYSNYLQKRCTVIPHVAVLLRSVSVLLQKRTLIACSSLNAASTKAGRLHQFLFQDIQTLWITNRLSTMEQTEPNPLEVQVCLV